MFCTNCGEPLEDGVRFCTSCGCPVEDAHEAVAGSAIDETDTGDVLEAVAAEGAADEMDSAEGADESLGEVDGGEAVASEAAGADAADETTVSPAAEECPGRGDAVEVPVDPAGERAVDDAAGEPSASGADEARVAVDADETTVLPTADGIVQATEQMPFGDGNPTVAKEAAVAEGDVPTPIEDAAVEEGAPAPVPPRKKKRLPIVLTLATVLVVAIGVGSYALLNGGAAGSGPVAVTYGAHGSTKVLPSARIVMYDSSGKPMSDYDVTVTDSEGNESTYHVDGDSFTPGDAGVTSGEATFSAKDPQTGEEHKLPVIVDKDDPESEGDIAVKPEQPDASDDEPADEDPAVSERQAAYKLYLDKVNERIEDLGDPDVQELEAAEDVERVTGLGFVQLIDFNRDGVEELVLAHGAAEGEYTLEVWSVEDGNLVCVGSVPVNNAGGGWDSILTLSEFAGAPSRFVLSSARKTYDEGMVYDENFVYATQEGKIVLTTFTFKNNTNKEGPGSSLFIDGVEVDGEEYWERYEALYGEADLGDPTYPSRCAYYLEGRLPTTATDAGGIAVYVSCGEVVERAKSTIDVLERGAKGDFTEMAVTDSDNTEDDEAGDTVTSKSVGTKDAKSPSDELFEGDKVKGIVGTLSGVTGPKGSWSMIELDEPITVYSAPAGIPVEARNVLLLKPNSSEAYEYDGSLGNGDPLVSGSGTIDVEDGTVYLHVETLEWAK